MTNTMGGNSKDAMVKFLVALVSVFLFFFFFVTWLSAMVQSKGQVFEKIWTKRAWQPHWDWIDANKDDVSYEAARVKWIASHPDSSSSYPATSAFADMNLEKSIAPGLQQRFDIGRSDTGDHGTTMNARLAASQVQPAAAFRGSRSGLTGGREAPYFPEGSMYNIEGKLREGALATGAEGFRRSRFDPEEQLHGQ